mmetsp:Transcript_13137/g.30282  ORF Transcript_13137/g.30282 Transcript_13137/m.30282 type:complete len:307 (-) Transcript_13137:5428-6348(-)
MHPRAVGVGRRSNRVHDGHGRERLAMEGDLRLCPQKEELGEEDDRPADPQQDLKHRRPHGSNQPRRDERQSSDPQRHNEGHELPVIVYIHVVGLPTRGVPAVVDPPVFGLVADLAVVGYEGANHQHDAELVHPAANVPESFKQDEHNTAEGPVTLLACGDADLLRCSVEVVPERPGHDGSRNIRDERKACNDCRQHVCLALPAPLLAQALDPPAAYRDALGLCEAFHTRQWMQQDAEQRHEQPLADHWEQDAEHPRRLGSERDLLVLLVLGRAVEPVDRDKQHGESVDKADADTGVEQREAVGVGP